MAPRSRLVTDTVRRLKRRWPTSITLIRRERGATNFVTGEQTVSETSVTIKRAILLPEREARTFVYDLAYLSGATSNMTQGGHFEEGIRYLIIDKRDVDPTVPASGDTVQVSGKFDAEVMESMEVDDHAYILRTRKIVGASNATT